MSVTLRKCYVKVVGIAFLAVVGAPAFALTRSINTIYGTLSYTVTSASQSCLASAGSPVEKPYVQTEYSDFYFTQGSVVTQLGGDIRTTYKSPATYDCPPNSHPPETFVEPNFTIVFTPVDAVGGTVTVTEKGTQGYVDPKFVVLGVTYAPPGPSSSTFVQYQNSTFVGTTKSVSASFQSSNTDSVSITETVGLPLVASGKITKTYSSTATQASKSSSTVTTSFSVQQGEKTAGTGNYFAPVDNDYDIVYVWLNPAAIFTVYAGDPVPVWNGYGVDTTDEAGMDIVAIQLGYLNGHFGAIPPDIQTRLNRTWAATQVFGSGQGPALTSADLAQIAAADPFSVSTYGTKFLGYAPPAGTTSDGRFTVSACSAESAFDYLQAAPSTTASVYSCQLTYANLTMLATDYTTSVSQGFSTDVSLSTGFLADFSADLKESHTLTWTTDAQNSITTSTTSVASLSVQGAPCGNVQTGVGPCVPVYDTAGNQPTEFQVYQDNVYGTFMFAPVHYY